MNLASRLEGQCKTYGVSIIVGEDTRQGAPDFAFVELDLVKVKGKTEPERMFALVGDAGMRNSEPFRVLLAAHEEFLIEYRAGNFAEARRKAGTAKERAEAAGWSSNYYAGMRGRLEGADRRSAGGLGRRLRGQGEMMEPAVVEARLAMIEDAVCREVGRGAAPLMAATRGHLARAARAIASVERPVIAIITGFFVPTLDPPMAETDGPVGAAHLAAAFTACGWQVRVATDTPCAGAVSVALRSVGEDGSDR